MKSVDKVKPTLVESQFIQEGVLTPEEFVAAGDMLVFKCKTWEWASGEPGRAVPYLPPNKQYLVTKNVRCAQRVASLENAGDESATNATRTIKMDAGDDLDDDDENVFLTMMEELGVVSQLETLAENHTDVAVCTAAERILDRFNEDDDFDDEDDVEDEGTDRMQSLMDAAAAEEAEEEESDDVITVPDMPSAGPITVPSSLWSSSAGTTAAPPTQSPFGFSFGSSQHPQQQQQQQFFFSSSQSQSSMTS